MEFDLNGTIAIIMVFGMPVAILLALLHYKYRRDKLWHETVRLALEKGQPIPELPGLLGRTLEQSAAENQNRMGRFRTDKFDRRGGLILIATGVGLYLGMTYSPDGQDYAWYAAIPCLIGLAMLVNSMLEASSAKNNPTIPDSTQRP